MCVIGLRQWRKRLAAEAARSSTVRAPRSSPRTPPGRLEPCDDCYRKALGHHRRQVLAAARGPPPADRASAGRMRPGHRRRLRPSRPDAATRRAAGRLATRAVPQAEVIVVPDIGYDDDSLRWAAYTREFLGAAPDVVFTSEAYGDTYARLLGARHVSVDAARTAAPVSGTAVRGRPIRQLALPVAAGALLLCSARLRDRRRVDGHDDARRRPRRATSAPCGCPSTAASTRSRSSTAATTPGPPTSSSPSPLNRRAAKTAPRASAIA